MYSIYVSEKLPQVVTLSYLPDNNNKDAICVVVLCLLCGEERRGSMSFYRGISFWLAITPLDINYERHLCK